MILCTFRQNGHRPILLLDNSYQGDALHRNVVHSGKNVRLFAAITHPALASRGPAGRFDHMVALHQHENHMLTLLRETDDQTIYRGTQFERN